MDHSQISPAGINLTGLTGRAFDERTSNCFTLLRDFFLQNSTIKMQRWANPHNWWEHGLSLYTQLLPQEGFELLLEPPQTWAPGDVVVMAILSPKGVPNHAGVLVDGDRLLHHFSGRVSAVEPYRLLYRHTTCAVYRHRAFTRAVRRMDLSEILPDAVRTRLFAPLADAGP